MISTWVSICSPIADFTANLAAGVTSMFTSTRSVIVAIGSEKPVPLLETRTQPRETHISTIPVFNLFRQSNRIGPVRQHVSGSRESDVIRISNHSSERIVDTLAIEVFLSMELTHKGATYPLGITMRTPGDDIDLTVGFLYSEGIIEQYKDIENISEAEGLISVDLTDDLQFDINSHRRQTLTSSACGVCGKVSLTNLHQIHTKTLSESFKVKSDQISDNLKLLNSIQPLFELTGGTHAAVAFDNNGNVIASREDVGRHNALDKLIGYMLRNGTLNTEDSVLHKFWSFLI